MVIMARHLHAFIALFELQDFLLICDAYRLLGPTVALPSDSSPASRLFVALWLRDSLGPHKDMICDAYQGLGPVGRDVRFETGKGMSQWLGIGVARKGSRTAPLAPHILYGMRGRAVLGKVKTVPDCRIHRPLVPVVRTTVGPLVWGGGEKDRA